ncbi:MAG: CapA family protein [Lachnospiraceae bacterium]|nr:CapA family protein [Lachnospiraceae bacterium]
MLSIQSETMEPASSDSPEQPNGPEQQSVPEQQHAPENLDGGRNPGGASITLAFAGDVLLSDHVLNAYQSGGGIQGVVGESLREAAKEADLFMVNQEFPFSNRGTAAPDKQFTFRLPPEKVSILKEMGIDLVTLANNHALDFGIDALLDTGKTLDEAGIPYVGAGENLDRAKELYQTLIGEKTVGFLGATRVIPVADWAASKSSPGMLAVYDPAILLEEIRKGKEACDYLVVYVHWGVEREERPKDYQRQLARQFIDAGADLVIGSHPHVLQGVEYYQGKPIVYSLGNFVFGSSIPRTVLLKAEWDGEKTSLSVIPAVSGAGYTREVTDEAKRQELFRYLESISYGVAVDETGTLKPVDGTE